MKIATILPLLALAAAPALVRPALAQTPPTAGGTTTGTAGTVMAPPQGGPASGSAGAPAASPSPQTPQGRAIEAGVERRISDLHNRLKITPAQQAAWNDFADTMRQNAAHADQVFGQQMPPGQQNALDSMRAYAQVTQAHAEDVQRLLPKFQALYDGLTPDQKRAADNTFAQYQRQMMRNASHPSG